MATVKYVRTQPLKTRMQAVHNQAKAALTTKPKAPVGPKKGKK
jgi:hypothetical protein